MTDHITSRILEFRRQHELCLHEELGPVWWATLGSVVLPLPNFRWRRDAIPIHDYNHILTGYGLDVSGELSIAAWELGVQCYRSRWARALCIFLAILGLIYQPLKTRRAYHKGVGAANAYRNMILSKSWTIPRSD
jgi:hypothetical protein